MSPNPSNTATQVAKPTAFPPGGEFDVTQLVTLLCATPGAVIHYTTDGSSPTADSPVFDQYKLIPTADGPDARGHSAHTIQAVAILDGRASEPAEFHYQINRRARDEYASVQAAPGVWTIRDFDNDKMYVIKGSKRAMLVDTGLGSGDLRDYVEEFTDGLPLDVVITHAHPDHVACTGQFQTDRDVYMNLTDMPMIDRFISQYGYDIDRNKFTDLREGAVFDLGDRKLKVYEVPGHSLGHIVLLDEERGDLFAADAVGNNRPTIVDALWMQMPGMLLIDEYLSSLQVFRAKTAGKIKAIYTGHNDGPLGGDAYLDNLERAVQLMVDDGVAALTPALRPVGVWQGFYGDRLTDPNWAGINVNRERFLTDAPGRIATLSNLLVNGAAVGERFKPAEHTYTAVASGPSAAITATTTGTRARLTINGAPVGYRQTHTVALAAGATPVTLEVTSPDGSVKTQYNLTIQRS